MNKTLCGACRAVFDWLDVPSLGLQDDGEGELLDLRNCPACGSTRALPVQSTELGPIEEVWVPTEKVWAHVVG